MFNNHSRVLAFFRLGFPPCLQYTDTKTYLEFFYSGVSGAVSLDPANSMARELAAQELRDMQTEALRKLQDSGIKSQ